MCVSQDQERKPDNKKDSGGVFTVTSAKVCAVKKSVHFE